MLKIRIIWHKKPAIIFAEPVHVLVKVASQIVVTQELFIFGKMRLGWWLPVWDTQVPCVPFTPIQILSDVSLKLICFDCLQFNMRHVPCKGDKACKLSNRSPSWFLRYYHSRAKLYPLGNLTWSGVWCKNSNYVTCKTCRSTAMTITCLLPGCESPFTLVKKYQLKILYCLQCKSRGVSDQGERFCKCPKVY